MTSPASPANPELYLHVRVMLGLILGLAVTRLVGGVATIALHPSRDRLPWIHLGWVAWALLNVVSAWWWEFGLGQVLNWGYGLYLFLFLYASMYFFTAALLFPDDIRDYEGYDDALIRRRGLFFGLVAITELMDVGDTWLKGSAHVQALGWSYAVRNAGLVIFCVIAARTQNLWFHRIFVTAALLYEIFFSIIHASD